MTTVLRGIPSFFTPNLFALRGAQGRDERRARRRTTAPRRCARRCDELIDWEYLCDCRTRLTVGAVNVCSGAMRYFDTREEPLGVDHVMASGALPPAFGAVRIDGEPYWDGGIYSNTPIEAVLDDKPRRDSLIFAVNVWHQKAAEPSSIWEVMARTQGHPVREPRRQPHRAPEADPPPAPRHPRADASSCRRRSRATPKVKELASWGCGTQMHVAHLLAPRLDSEDHTKDIDFTPGGIRARREAGHADTMRMIERAPWQAPADPIEGVIEHV